MISAAKGATERGGTFYRNRKREALRKSTVMHQSIPAAPSPSPPSYCGVFARLISPGGGAFANFALPGGQAFANPRGHSRAFDTQNITTYTDGFTGKKQIGSLVKDRNKL